MQQDGPPKLGTVADARREMQDLLYARSNTKVRLYAFGVHQSLETAEPFPSSSLSFLRSLSAMSLRRDNKRPSKRVSGEEFQSQGVKGFRASSSGVVPAESKIEVYAPKKTSQRNTHARDSFHVGGGTNVQVRRHSAKHYVLPTGSFS